MTPILLYWDIELVDECNRFNKEIEHHIGKQDYIKKIELSI